jgi:hypothetical protein
LGGGLYLRWQVTAAAVADHTDTLIRMVDRRVSQLWGRANNQAKTAACAREIDEKDWDFLD